MANKARYYGLATHEEKQDVERKDKAARVYPSGPLSYRAVVAAILNYKDNNNNFDELPTKVAASRIASELTKTGLYGTVKSVNTRIVGEDYSIALTNGRGTGGKTTPSKVTEQKK